MKYLGFALVFTFSFSCFANSALPDSTYNFLIGKQVRVSTKTREIEGKLVAFDKSTISLLDTERQVILIQRQDVTNVQIFTSTEVKQQVHEKEKKRREEKNVTIPIWTVAASLDLGYFSNFRSDAFGFGASLLVSRTTGTVHFRQGLSFLLGYYSFQTLHLEASYLLMWGHQPHYFSIHAGLSSLFLGEILNSVGSTMLFGYRFERQKSFFVQANIGTSIFYNITTPYPFLAIRGQISLGYSF